MKMKKVLFFIAATVLITGVFSSVAFGASKYITKSMSLNKTTTVVYYSDYVPVYYKVIVPEDGYITVSSTGVASIYDYKKIGDVYSSNLDCLSKVNGSFAVDKGTYYFRFSLAANNKSAKVKFTFKKAVNKTNYCVSKAESLSAGSTVTICQTKNSHYARWYKIKVSSNKKVNIYTNQDTTYLSQVTLLDSSLKKISVSKSGSCWVTDSKLKKGTYYLKVADPTYYYTSSVFSPELITLKWK